MAESDALQQATARLGAAVDGLENVLGPLIDEEDSVATLKQKLRFLTDERDRLLSELDAERSRARRLEAANDEVSGRLEAVMGTLREMAPEGNGMEA
jgi:chromosome segregation ATPase